MEHAENIRSYRDLLVWQKGMDLAVEVYGLSKRLPPSERYGLASQMQRAAASVPSNIAEGHGRRHRGDYIHHLSISNGSLKEVETHLLLCVRLELLQQAHVERAMALGEGIGKMLTVLVRRLRG